MDRVRPLKFEDPATGGTQVDEFPTSVNPREDHIDARGYFIQNDASSDELVHVGRDALDNLTFQDGVVTGVKTLADLLAGGMSAETHRQLDQLAHDLDESYDVLPTFDANGVLSLIVAQDAVPMSIRVFDQLSVDGNGIISTMRLRQFDGAGAVAETMELAVTNPGMPSLAAWTRTP